MIDGGKDTRPGINAQNTYREREAALVAEAETRGRVDDATRWAVELLRRARHAEVVDLKPRG